MAPPAKSVLVSELVVATGWTGDAATTRAVFDLENSPTRSGRAQRRRRSKMAPPVGSTPVGLPLTADRAEGAGDYPRSRCIGR